MQNLKKSIKKFPERFFTVAFGLTVALHQVFYWHRALDVSKHVYEGLWTSRPPGTFFPWPKPPGMMTVLSSMDSLDRFIYFLMETGLYIPVAFVAVLAMALLGFHVGKYYRKRLLMAGKD